MKWADVLQDKSLQDLPYKIETNQFGQIVMSPASPLQGMIQAEIVFLIKSLSSTGRAISECPVETNDGVKVPDVAWASDELRKQYRGDVSFAVAPEICVEICSPSNSSAEILQKTALYFLHGAHEVWTCDLAGQVRFFTPEGEQPRSALFPAFPTQINVG
jgi:Uma2 family endonuclease